MLFLLLQEWDVVSDFIVAVHDKEEIVCLLKLVGAFNFLPQYRSYLEQYVFDGP